ncbi:unnamed protein product [Alopecurus aequalis]
MEADELLKKIRALEEGQAELEREVGKLVQERRGARSRHPPPAFPPHQPSSSRRAIAAPPHSSSQLHRDRRPRLSDRHCHLILQSLGQAVHIVAPDGKLLYWNRYAEHIYGYSASEAIGRRAVDLLVHPADVDAANIVIENIFMGKCFRGKFPVKNKSGERFFIVVHNTPLYDDDGTLVGLICLSLDVRTLEEIFSSSATVIQISSEPHFHVNNRTKSGSQNKGSFDSQQPLRSAIASKTTTFAAKVTNEQSRQKLAVPEPITIPDCQDTEYTQAIKYEVSGSWWTFDNNSMSPMSSTSTNDSPVERVDYETNCLDSEILWEDLVIGEQIGQGSCGTVYHSLWYGSDVAVKVFSKQEYSEEMINTFRQEVSLMKKLRHPNIVLFMGAVASQQRLCIVMEFLPRGSLFRLLQNNIGKLDPRRRINMAIDIARGMNYLHNSIPTVVHRDLKSSNLLVDKKWTVDFGLSRLKLETFMATKTGKGTPQWMAPEVLRTEPSNEKSDVYSYGVVLWELVTQKIPWNTLSTVQVIGAVGFMDQRREIPSNTDPEWASIIESCWDSDPQRRPSFQELLERLQELQKQYALRAQTQRKMAGKMGGEDS